jgi:hypothetical protein
MDIWMTDWSDKSDCGRFVGISVWNDDIEFPETVWLFLVREVERQSGMVGRVTLVCGVWEAFEHGSPVGQLLIVDGTEVE